MGQNCILPFGWDNFVPAISHVLGQIKFKHAAPHYAPTYKRRAQNRHLHN
jgi:hypothetical protein